MGLGSLFQKKTNYFDRQMAPKCGYCQFGKRTKEGNRILCSKFVSLKEEHDSCNKFVYSPLKRVPVKQLKNEGFVADEEIYVEVEDKEPEKKPEPAAAAPSAQAAPVTAPAPTVEPAAPAEQPVPVAQPVAAAAVPAVEPVPVQAPAADAVPTVQAAAIPGFGDLNELAQAAALVDAASAAEAAPEETN